MARVTYPAGTVCKNPRGVAVYETLRATDQFGYSRAVKLGAARRTTVACYPGALPPGWTAEVPATAAAGGAA